jgi:hypothetical protein
MELSWKDRIASKDVWNALAHAPEDSRFARQSVVKVIIELVNPPSHDEVKVYFLQSKKWYLSQPSLSSSLRIFLIFLDLSFHFTGCFIMFSFEKCSGIQQRKI